jgi:hypothetical protein
MRYFEFDIDIFDNYHKSFFKYIKRHHYEIYFLVILSNILIQNKLTRESLKCEIIHSVEILVVS